MKQTEEIAEIEWEMFQEVHNQGGRADCQDDRTTFFIMRKSQLGSWPEELKASYLEDLLKAREQGKNLLTWKYAYMMERTAPKEYVNIRKFLPAVSEKKQKMIDGIVEKQVRQFRELARSYPRFMGNARRGESSGDGEGETSFETYLWGELRTYSERTLELYEAFMETEEGRCLVKHIMADTARQYGYPSLEKAEQSLGF